MSSTPESNPEATEPTTPASAGGTPDPEQLRVEIEDTRRELGETVAALSAKTDVKAQAQAKASDVKAQAQAKASDVKATVQEKKDDLLGRAKEVSPDSAMAAASSGSAKVRENPLPAAVAAAFLGGFVLGRLTAR